MEVVAAEARASGCAKGFVITSSTNEPALALYRSVGGVVNDDADVEMDFSYRSESSEITR